MIGPSHTSDLDLHRRKHSLLDPAVFDILAHKRTVRATELILLQDLPHRRNLVRRQGYHIWDTPHEDETVHLLRPSQVALRTCTPVRIRLPAPQARGCRHQGIRDEQVAIEEEDQTAREVAAQLENRDAGLERAASTVIIESVYPYGHFRFALVEDEDLPLIIPLGEPFVVLLREVYFAVKGSRPKQMRGVVMRMRDDHGADAAEFVDLADGRFIQKSDAIPEDVARGRLDKSTALADAYLGRGMDEDDALIFGVWGEMVLIFLRGGRRW